MLCFSSFCCFLKIEIPPLTHTTTTPTTNHQQSAAAGPVGTGFGKRVPEMSLINSFRGRAREGVVGDEGFWGEERGTEAGGGGWVMTKRWSGSKEEDEEEKEEIMRRGRQSLREERRSEVSGVRTEQWTKQRWSDGGALIRHRTSAPSHFPHWQRENARTGEWRWMGGRVWHQDMKRKRVTAIKPTQTDQTAFNRRDNSKDGDYAFSPHHLPKHLSETLQGALLNMFFFSIFHCCFLKTLFLPSHLCALFKLLMFQCHKGLKKVQKVHLNTLFWGKILKSIPVHSKMFKSKYKKLDCNISSSQLNSQEEKIKCFQII